jgi:hypothetical protein
MSFLSFISRLLGMSEKTPYQAMREQQQDVINKQKLDAENRAEAYKKSIEFNTQEELNRKLEKERKETERFNLLRKQEEEERKERARRRQAQQSSHNQYLRESAWHDQGYSGRSSSSSSCSSSSSSSSSHSSYDSCSSSSSSDSSSSCSSSSSSSCDF